MKSARVCSVFLFVGILALGGLICLCHTTPAVSRAKASAMRHYKVIDLGNFDFLAINDKGQIVGGTKALSVQDDAILWENGKMTVLKTVPGIKDTRATDINDKGEIVGVVHDEKGNSRAVLWKDGKITELGTLGGRNCQAAAINNKGEIAGMADLPKGDDLRAFLYSDGKMHDLGTLGGTSNIARGINNLGEVVGEATLPRTPTRPLGLVHAFLYSKGKMRDLGTLPGYPEGTPNAINDVGEVVGYCDNQSGSRACLWRGGRTVDLGVMGGESSIAAAINNKEDIVGTFWDKAGNMRAFLVTNQKMVSLTKLVEPQGWVIYSANSINDRGEIIAGGKYKGKDSAVLLEPVPEEN